MYQWTLSRVDVLDVERAESLLRTLGSQAPGAAEHALVLVAGDLLATTRDGDHDR